MKDIQIDKPGLYIAGPLFLICTQALAIHFGEGEAVYLLFISLLGLLLCSYFNKKGCFFSLLFIGLGILAKYGFSDSYGLWQMGLEGSVACSFVITTLMLDQQKSKFKSLFEVAKTRESTILNLEEDLSKIHEATLSDQLSLQEKNVELQKELEEMGTEHSSVLILNEVLRKTAAAQTQEAEELAKNGLEQEKRIGSFLAEIDALQKELVRVSNESGLLEENGQLRQELTVARDESEQMHQTNENLARLHTKEMEKAQELSEKLHALHANMQKVQEEHNIARGENRMLSTHLEQLTEELEKALTSLKQAEKVQIEKNFLTERLANAEAQMAAMNSRMEILAQRPETCEEREKLIAKEAELVKMGESLQDIEQKLSGNDGQLAQLEQQLTQAREKLDGTIAELSTQRAQLEQKEEEINLLREQLNNVNPQELKEKLAERETTLSQIEERLKDLSQTESLYKQLKAQFEEKNTVLGETRTKLFHTETKLQQIQIEKEQAALAKDPLPSDWEKDIRALEEEISNLQAENIQLQEIISQLSRGETPPPPQLEF